MKTNFIRIKEISGWAFLLSLTITIAACSSEDDGPSNQAPDKALLLNPSNQAKDLEVGEVELKWKAATDPDDDAVSYDVYLDTILPPEEKIMGDVSEVNLKLQNDLKYSTTYYWSVVAKDESGAESNSDMATFTTRDPMIEDLIVGKWFMEGAVVDGNEIIASECLSQTYFEFMADQTLRFVQYSGSPCSLVEDQIYNYEIIDASTIVLTLSTNSTSTVILEVISITETHLELLLSGNTKYILGRE